MSIAFEISGRNRKRKYENFLNAFPVQPDTTILDVGYTDLEYTGYDNYLEKHYPHPENITALGVVEPKEFAARYPKVRTVQYDGTVFPFADKQFDICWSNAVIEHVGNFEKQVFFLKEVKRVAKSAYLTTPNRYFPIEVHTRLPFLHWLPREIFNRILVAVGKDYAAGDYMFLLSLGDVKRLLAAAGIADYTIIKNRFFGFTMDFAVAMRF